MAFGRLERSKGSTPMAEINVTPMVDVMLVLVVIFIITAPLLAGSIRLDLPRTDGATPATPARFVTVTLDKNGQLFLDDQPVTADELARQLARAAHEDPATELQLRADQSVPYGRIVELMGAAHQAGLARIGFVAEARTAKPAR